MQAKLCLDVKYAFVKYSQTEKVTIKIKCVKNTSSATRQTKSIHIQYIRHGCSIARYEWGAVPFFFFF